MLRRRRFDSRFEDEYDPGPVQIQARRVHFDVSDIPLHWIPGHPVASNFASLLNIVLPPIERWFVAVFNEALPLVKDPKLAEDMRGFIGGLPKAELHVHLDGTLEPEMAFRLAEPAPRSTRRSTPAARSRTRSRVRRAVSWTRCARCSSARRCWPVSRGC